MDYCSLISSFDDGYITRSVPFWVCFCLVHYQEGITTLHNGMILSTLNITSHEFSLVFHKRPRNRQYFSLINPFMIFH